VARVLFVCHQNAGRSQMSEALFQRAADGRHESRSAGTRPAEQVHPVVVQAMREVGIDLSQKRPVPLTDDLARWADVVVTMGCGDECPFIPGKTYVDWDLRDPAGMPLDPVRALRVDIDRRVKQLAHDLDASHSAASTSSRDA
jgi:arsenate reductase (thioredoxin)